MPAPSVAALRREYLDAWIKHAITLLDQLDGDPDLEDGGDIEPNLAEAHSDLEDDPVERDPWTVPAVIGR